MRQLGLALCRRPVPVAGWVHRSPAVPGCRRLRACLAAPDRAAPALVGSRVVLGWAGSRVAPGWAHLVTRGWADRRPAADREEPGEARRVRLRCPAVMASDRLRPSPARGCRPGGPACHSRCRGPGAIPGGQGPHVVAADMVRSGQTPRDPPERRGCAVVWVRPGLARQKARRPPVPRCAAGWMVAGCRRCVVRWHRPWGDRRLVRPAEGLPAQPSVATRSGRPWRRRSSATRSCSP